MSAWLLSRWRCCSPMACCPGKSQKSSAARQLQGSPCGYRSRPRPTSSRQRLQHPTLMVGHLHLGGGARWWGGWQGGEGAGQRPGSPGRSTSPCHSCPSERRLFVTRLARAMYSACSVRPVPPRRSNPGGRGSPSAGQLGIWLPAKLPQGGQTGAGGHVGLGLGRVFFKLAEVPERPAHWTPRLPSQVSQ